MYSQVDAFGGPLSEPGTGRAVVDWPIQEEGVAIALGVNPLASALSQHEAIGLAYALTANAAELVGVRALAVKGVVASIHRLRAERTPADVDVLIEPDGFAAFIQQLHKWGWRDRYGGSSDFPFGGHSLPYVNDRWPCDIDAHRRFPGFLAPPQQVFEELWKRRQLLLSAGRLVPMTDWAGSVAIMALHSVRNTTDDPRHADELRHLIDLSRSWTHDQRADLSDLARATGCLQSLDAVWQRLGVPIDATTECVPAVGLAEWRTQVNGRVPGNRVWLRYLRGAGQRQVLTRARMMLWPPETLMRASRPIAEGNLALFHSRLTRLAGALPRVARHLLAISRAAPASFATLLSLNPNPRPGDRKKPEGARGRSRFGV